MNERIQQLAEQATKQVTKPDGHYIVQEWQKVFAQLIVQDCIDIISPYTVRMSRPGEEYLHPILEIRKHFGVEE